MLSSYLSHSVKKLLSLPGTHRVDHGAGLTSKALSVPLLREAISDFQLELSRSRRYERSFSVVLLATSVPEANASAHGRPNQSRPAGRAAWAWERPQPHFTALFMGARLRDLLRQSDRIAYASSDDRFVIALPETDQDQARQALQRIKPELQAWVRMDCGAGIAAFPEDGLTFSELVERAEAHWHRQLELHEVSTNGAAPRPEDES